MEFYRFVAGAKNLGWQLRIWRLTIDWFPYKAYPGAKRLIVNWGD